MKRYYSTVILSVLLAAASYDILYEIAPVVYLAVDTDAGMVE